MGKQYRHLKVTERERLAKMYYEGHSLAEMAKALRRNKSTIARELRYVQLRLLQHLNDVKYIQPAVGGQLLVAELFSNWLCPLTESVERRVQCLVAYIDYA